MSGEPLWRGKTEDRAAPFFDGACSVIEVHLAVPPGTEVEVRRAGDRTPVTREQIACVLDQWFGAGNTHGHVQVATDAVLALLHGQGDETDGD